MLERIGLSQHVVWWIVSVSAVMFVAGLLLLPWLLARMPSDYFLTHRDYLPHWKQTHPVLRYVVLGVRNLIGLALILLGIVMIFTPGQGLLSLLVGLSMTTFPGKRTLELKLIRSKGVLKAINWIRRKQHRDPLVLPPESHSRHHETVTAQKKPKV
jgi:hypothetical protein